MKKRHIILNNKLRVIYTLTGQGNPNKQIEGVFGQDYIDTNNGTIYMCASIPSGKYWKKLINKKEENTTPPSIENDFAFGFFAKGSNFDKTRMVVGIGNPNNHFLANKGTDYLNRETNNWYKSISRGSWPLISKKSEQGNKPSNIRVVIREPILLKGVRKDLKYYSGKGNPNYTFGGITGEIFFDLESEILYKCSAIPEGTSWKQLTET